MQVSCQRGISSRSPVRMTEALNFQQLVDASMHTTGCREANALSTSSTAHVELTDRRVPSACSPHHVSIPALC